MQFYPQILGLIDTLNDWNDKLNDFASSHMDNVWVGAAAVGIAFFLAAWGIRALNKRE
mgnify:CR=1 FL=1